MAGPMSDQDHSFQTVDIADVADDIVTLEICASQAADLCPGLRRDRARNPLDRWLTWDVTARLYRLKNVVLDRTHMVVLHAGRIVSQTNYLQPPGALAALRVDVDTLVRIPPGPVAAICFDHWDANFYHWTAHTIPALHVLLARHPECDVRPVLPTLQPWQREFLRLMGADRLPAITTEPGRQYVFPELDYLDITAGSLDFAISPLSRAAYASVAGAVTPLSGPALKIYIDRTGTSHRRLGNEAALIAALRARGFTILRPETMPLAQQIAVFRAAAMVVGMLGAGLANIAWCRPGTVVYEIIASHHLNPCFMVMAQQGELTYWADMFDSGVEGNGHMQAWAVDLDVAAVLQRIGDLEALMTL